MVRPAAVDAVFANGRFVDAGALLDDRHRAPHRAERLEIAQQHHGVGEIGDVDRRLHVADQAMLRHRHEGRRTPAVEILQQFVHMQDQRILFGHRRLIAVEAVDHHGLDVVLVDPLADPMGEFAGRQLRGVDLLDEKIAAALHLLEIDAEALHAREQQAEFFVEHEQRRLLAAPRSRRRRRRSRPAICRCRPGRESACSSRSRRRRRAAGPTRRSRSTSVLRTKLVRYSDATSRGNTLSPPVVMVAS